MKINNLILKTVLIINFQLLIFNCFAQSDSLEIHHIKGKAYYIHIVAQGESLYAIHKKYNVPQQVIKKENPSVLDGLSIGEKIFIPVKANASEGSVDGNFINHTVLKKQTLYAIAKIYKVKQREIIAVNPEIEGGLKEGQIIKIPVKEIQKQVEPPKVVKSNNKNKTHLVKKGETLYSLGKKYNVTIAEIKAANNGLKKGLKVDETIYIPFKIKIVSINDSLNPILEEPSLPVVNELHLNLQDLATKKPIYKIGLMLPFYLDENDEVVQNRNALDKKAIYPKSKFAIEFYKGFLTGLDDISNDSCQFQVYVYDTKGKDSVCTRKLLLKPEMKTLDLIVGPLYNSNFKQVAAFAKNNQIPIVSPVKQNNKILLGNQYVFKAIPSKPTIIDKIVTLTVDSFKTDNLIAIVDEKAKEKSLVDLYIKAYNDKILSAEDTLMYSAINKLSLTSSYAAILPLLNLNKNNVLFVPSTNTSFIPNLFSLLFNTLTKKNYEDYQITLIGLEEWLSYENIDLEYFQKLNVYVPVTQNVNYEDSLTNSFVESYVEENKTYPSKITFLGNDIANYFGTGLKNTGSVFNPTFITDKIENYSIKFNFIKTGVESGFENHNSYLLHFEDYTLKKIY